MWFESFFSIFKASFSFFFFFMLPIVSTDYAVTPWQSHLIRSADKLFMVTVVMYVVYLTNAVLYVIQFM